jgi:uncharacterized protein (DUF2147 family)
MIAALLAAAAAADVPAGMWVTQDGSALVRVEPCATSICGSVARVLASGPGTPDTDVHNPDQGLRHRPLVGLPILGGFHWSGRQWTNGRIYDPKTGNTYRSQLSLEPDGSLRVSGCVLFVCQSQRWPRAR